ncbi:hypothetical protein LV475_09180 [Guyparkeria hydrothermalis]|uniref:Uncharacterized protein n=1 Tax=Guyparkeria halophila TaxID=47960 RepID=A0A6I6D0Z0_9GAMM|nr:MULTISPECIES: hypothetical protein [Guyparkeria]MCL7751761.1 hypothetical protein [Guyparkeria hydrothermalis]QGT78568.1 hypothetical protein GM160_06465 [Guyparkeria halophila]
MAWSRLVSAGRVGDEADIANGGQIAVVLLSFGSFRFGRPKREIGRPKASAYLQAMFDE